jgi:hypothetical protein
MQVSKRDSKWPGGQGRITGCYYFHYYYINKLAPPTRNNGSSNNNTADNYKLSLSRYSQPTMSFF